MEKGEPAVRNYMKFLKGGGSKDPIDLLKIAGVDMSSSEPIKQQWRHLRSCWPKWSKEHFGNEKTICGDNTRSYRGFDVFWRL
jgi:hypothetical protein